MSDYPLCATNVPVSGGTEATGPASGSFEGPSAPSALSDAELAALRGEGSNSGVSDDGLVLPDRPSSVCQLLECEPAAARMDLAAAAGGPGEDHEIPLVAPLEAERLPARRLFPTRVDALLARWLGG